MRSFAEHALPFEQKSYSTDATLLCSCMGESKYQEARKFSTSFVNRDVLETRYYPNSMATEVLPPIDNVVPNISTKFLTKVLQYHDHLRKRGI